MMIKNYLKILIRQVLKRKAYFIINMVGLTTAIAAVLLSTVFILDEYSYDQFHTKKSDVYRLYKNNVSINDGTERLTSETSGLMGPTIVSDYPEAIGFTRVLPWFDETVISHDEKNVFIEYPVFVDSSFFSTFNFQLITGNSDEALNRPSTIVLSESLAQNLFGTEDPIGKTVVGLHELPFEVTGIVEDAPENSHLQYDALISWTTTTPSLGPLPYNFMNNWLGQTVLTYIELQPLADVAQLESKFPGMMQEYFPERANSYFLKLQALGSVYLGSGSISNTIRIKQGNLTYVRVFGFTALFILIIACVNYINISTAKATRRASEVGMRKVLGAKKKQLVSQFLGESFIITLLAAGLALLVADVMLPSFNLLVGKNLTSDAFFKIELLLAFIVIILTVGFMAGLYPALILSSFRPSAMLSAADKRRSSGHVPRQILTTIQFVIALALIICTLVVFKQISFLQNRELGFDKEHVVVLDINNSIEAQYATFKDQLLAHPDILKASVGQGTIGTGTFGTTVFPEGREDDLSVNIFRTDANFIETLGIEMDQGRSFDPQRSSDSSSLIINETFAQLLGWEDPIGKTLRFSNDGPGYPIIGVTKDFHFEGLNKNKVRPIVLYNFPGNFRSVTLRLSGNNLRETLAYMETTWEQYESKYPFDYYFADSWFNQKYKKESSLLDTIAVFSTISILLACMGLYGLTAFTIEQRTKEIGIRKVLGATVTELTILLNKKFILLLMAAFVVAVPAVYYVMSSWLRDFAYRIDISTEPFVLALLLTGTITLLAVSSQALTAALANPAKTLKSE